MDGALADTSKVDLGSGGSDSRGIAPDDENIAAVEPAQQLASFCPMTSRIKGYPFEVVVSEEPPSAVLADHVKSLDWRAQKATRKGKASPLVLAEVQAMIRALLGL